MIYIIEISLKIPLANKEKNCFNGMAFDGCQYYLTNKWSDEITVLNCDFEPIDCIHTCKTYSSLSYDTVENCFWAIDKQCGSFIYKLNCNFCECDCITIPSSCDSCGDITGVSYCCESDMLLVSKTDSLILIDKNGCLVKHIRSASISSTFTATLCTYPLFFYLSFKNFKYTLYLISCEGNVIDKILLPNDYIPQAMVLNPCKDKCGVYHIFILACKNGCYPYIIDLRLNACYSDMINDCNECLCKKGACPCSCKSKENCNKILESIALQEAALAHILNAEGEKLQKVIADDASVCDLLKINESVQKTIVHATHLEQVLFAKLESLQKCCDICEPSPPPCPHIHEDKDQ